VAPQRRNLLDGARRLLAASLLDGRRRALAAVSLLDGRRRVLVRSLPVSVAVLLLGENEKSDPTHQFSVTVIE
jgi:hypothetical protein